MSVAFSAAIDFISADCRRETRPSTAPKSPRASTGDAIFQSPAPLVSMIVESPLTTSSRSTLSRSMLRIACREGRTAAC
jgi:hypothetical protein